MHSDLFKYFLMFNLRFHQDGLYRIKREDSNKY